MSVSIGFFADVAAGYGNKFGAGAGAGGNNNPYAQQDAEKLQSKFAKASAISSDAFFDRGDDRAAVQAKLNKFSGSAAISSDAYFDREPPPEDDDDDLGTIDLGDAINAVADQATQLKNAAAKFFDDWTK